MTSNKPWLERLQNGREFEAKVKASWDGHHDGKALTPERPVTSAASRSGRIDLFVDIDHPEPVYRAVLEVKNTDWDQKTITNVRRNVLRHIRQVYRYIDSLNLEGFAVAPGIIYSKQPSDTERRKYIEDLLEEHLIGVVWQDETVKERRRRAPINGIIQPLDKANTPGFLPWPNE